MEQELESSWIIISDETTLHEGDLISRIELIAKKECMVIYRVLGSAYNFFEGMVPIQEMARDGIALKEEERITISLTFDYIIENKFRLMLDDSYDQINWPKTLSQALEILRSKLTENQISEIIQMEKEEFISNYIFAGTWIRNYFGLWRGNFDLLLDVDEKNPEADNVSLKILEKFWDQITSHSK